MCFQKDQNICIKHRNRRRERAQESLSNGTFGIKVKQVFPCSLNFEFLNRQDCDYKRNANKIQCFIVLD